MTIVGIPLGLWEPAPYEQVTIDLQPGDRLLFYSDGLPDSLESRAPHRGEGERQVAELLETHGSEPAAATADRLLAPLAGLAEAGTGNGARGPAGAPSGPAPLADDVTFVLVHIH